MVMLSIYSAVLVYYIYFFLSNIFDIDYFFFIFLLCILPRGPCKFQI